MPSTVPEATAFPDYSDYLHVVVAVIDNGRGEVLIAKRHDHLHQGGVWEFPGGKVEAGEDVSSALRRELFEELGVEPLTVHPLIRIPYTYPERKVLLDVWRVSEIRGTPHGAEGQAIKWVVKQELAGYEFPAANRPIITAAQLPPIYLITPEPGPQAKWPTFLQLLETSLQAGVTLLQLRAPELDQGRFLQLADEVIELSHRYGAKVLLNAEVAMLDQCNADGIHLNSRRLIASGKRPVVQDKLLAASCHSVEELHCAERVGVDFALLSPVKQTTSHPDATPLGWQRFHALSEQCAIPLYALGGLTREDLSDAWQHGAQGIAAIRSLWLG
jgi:8-oxo-dGTP diphosphatase